MKSIRLLLAVSGVLAVAAAIYGGMASVSWHPTGTAARSPAASVPQSETSQAGGGAIGNTSRIKTLEQGVTWLKTQVADLRQQLSQLDRPQVRLDQKTASVSDVASLRTALNKLADTVARLSAEVGQHAGAEHRLTSEAVDDEATGSLPPPDSETWAQAQKEEELREQERLRQHIDAIASHFQSEPVDAEWAAHATNVIQQAFASEELARAGLLYSECRSSLCQVEVSHDNPLHTPPATRP